MKKNYDLSALMSYAWTIFRNKANKVTEFGEALRRAWSVFDHGDENRKAIEDKKTEMGITEEVHTYGYYLSIGRKVKHDEHNVFQVLLHIPEKGIGRTYLTSFFTYSQTGLAENVA